MVKFVLVFEREDAANTCSSLNTAPYKINVKKIKEVT